MTSVCTGDYLAAMSREFATLEALFAADYSGSVHTRRCRVDLLGGLAKLRFLLDHLFYLQTDGEVHPEATEIDDAFRQLSALLPVARQALKGFGVARVSPVELPDVYYKPMDVTSTRTDVLVLTRSRMNLLNLVPIE